MSKKIKILQIAVMATVSLFLYTESIYPQTQGEDSGGSEWGEEPANASSPQVKDTIQTGEEIIQKTPVPANNQLPYYVVKKGDCLWNLAFQFFGNPFLWPQIWQYNSYIKNPDLIYPGDILKLSGFANEGGGESTANVNNTSGETSSAVLTSKTGELLKKTDLQKDLLDNTISKTGFDSTFLTIIRSKDHLGGSFFASVPFLWFERNSSGVLLPGESFVEKPKDRAMYQLYDKITITLKNGEMYKVGDSIDIYNYFRVITYNGARATILKCVGSARLIEVKKSIAFAQLYKAYDKVLGGEHLMKAAHVSSQQIDTLVLPDVTIQGTVITRAEETASPYVFETLIIDKGSEDGVKLGDVFAVYHNNEKELTTDISVIGFIANVQKKSSSMIIIKMSDNNIKTSDRAVLIRRTVFKSGGTN